MTNIYQFTARKREVRDAEWDLPKGTYNPPPAEDKWPVLVSVLAFIVWGLAGWALAIGVVWAFMEGM